MIHTIEVTAYDAGWRVTTSSMTQVDGPLYDEEETVVYVDNLTDAIDILRNIRDEQGERS
jgi:alanine dehydrogenase